MAGHKETTNACRILTGNLLKRPKDEGISVVMGGGGCDKVNWCKLAQDSIERMDIISVVMEIRFVDIFQFCFQSDNNDEYFA
jgi:hypothetical protein